MRRIGLALVASIGLWGASSAQADEFTAIQYSLSGSSLVVNAPLAGSAPAAGTMTLALQSVGGVPIVSGSVQVLTFNFIANPLTIGFVTGSVQNVLLAPFNSGHLTAGHAVFGGPGAVGVISLNGFLHCQNTSAICALANLPASIPVPISGTAPFPLGPLATPVVISPLQFNSLGNFDTFTQARGFILGTNTTGTIFLTGSEIARTTLDLDLKVPEPGSLGLIAAGALGLAGVAFVRRRRS